MRIIVASMTASQLELGINRHEEPDRNSEKGGRSFYFFDLDDNVFFLTTPIFLFHKKTGKEIALSSREWALHHHQVGHIGSPYENYFIDMGENGSFRRFRDYPEKNQQPFVEDLIHSLQKADFEWKGPSWTTFYHATFNQRPVSIITARGHAPETIQSGIGLFVDEGHLPKTPNFLKIYPVSHGPTQLEIHPQGNKLSIADLKYHAIINSVEKAMQVYGHNPHHRFGMSDDDPKNLELILQAMKNLKSRYSDNSFFVIHTVEQGYVKEEVFLNRIETVSVNQASQLNLF